MAISINREAMKTVRTILDDADALGVTVERLANGCTVIDMGLHAKGGWRAARLYTLVTIGGLGEVSYEPFEVAGRMLSAVRVMIDHPIEGCVASQIAGWRLESPGKEHAAILAGPGRALNTASLDHYFEWTDYRDKHHEAVVAIQASEPITVAMADLIAESCEVDAGDLYVLIAPNQSLVCAVQVAARIVEQTLHRLAEEGMDLRSLRHAFGFGVIPPLIDEVRVEVVNVDVVVTDAQGLPIAGLRPEDFTVYEDGEKREISNFFSFTNGVLTPEEGIAEEPAAEADWPDQNMLRRMALLFDTNSLEKL